MYQRLVKSLNTLLIRSNYYAWHTWLVRLDCSEELEREWIPLSSLSSSHPSSLSGRVKRVTSSSIEIITETVYTRVWIKWKSGEVCDISKEIRNPRLISLVILDDRGKGMWRGGELLYEFHGELNNTINKTWKKRYDTTSKPFESLFFFFLIVRSMGKSC